MYEGNHLADALSSATTDDHHRIFAHHTGGTLSYGTLFDGANRIAACLIEAGLQPGDRVAAQIAKSLEAVQLYLGTVIAGGAFLPLNTAYTPAEIAYFLDDASPHVFICDPGREATLAGQATDVPVQWTLAADGTGTLTDAAGACEPIAAAVPRAAGDLAAILYTSGTTGRSKGAMLTHRALASNSLTLRDAWGFSQADVLIHALPIFHTHGLFVATNVTLLAGSAVIFQPGFKAADVLDALPRATAMMGVPTFYTRLLDESALTMDLTANIRLFVSGSAPLLAETHAAWQARTGHAILERYGMTETNMNTSNPYDGPRKPGTVGQPLPGVEVIVTDPATGAPLALGEIGMVEVRGPNVFAGYWQMPEKTAEELRPNGFFITGDLGTFGADGYLSIVGRSKDLIITGGFNVYPKEIEAALDDLPGVKESAVIGVPHPDFGEGVIGVIVPEPGAAPDLPALSATIARSLAKFKQPKHLFLIEELPRNTMGKVQKNILRTQYETTFTG